MAQKNGTITKAPSNDQITEADKAAKDLLGQYSAQVFKSYLPRIAKEFEVVNLPPSSKPEESVAYFDITKLIVEESSNMFEKLKNVYHLVAYSQNSIALIIRRTHDACGISLAVGMKNRDSEATAKLSETIRGALVGNFPGSACSEIGNYGSESGNPFAALGETYFNKECIDSFNSIAVASNIASEFSKDYLEQGLEKVLDGIIPASNQEYTIMLLAESIDDERLEKKRQELYQMYTWLSPLAKRTENWSFQESQNWGKNTNANLMVICAGMNSGGSTASTQGASVEINQYAVSHTMEIIEKQMERIEHCAALGAYDFSAYVLSPSCQLASEVAHMYMSLTQGNESYFEKPSINVWNAQKDAETQNKISAMAEYLRRLIHPAFTEEKSHNVKATAMISGAELALAMSLPRKSLPGFTTIQCAAFGREITSYDADYSGDVCLGCVHHMHRNEEKSVFLNKDSLASHVFVTGSTGSGKSNAVYTLLDSLETTFMVIEPAKGEYKYAFGSGVKVYGTNPQMCELLRINPFVFNPGIHVYEHIDRLLDVFNVCWPMYAAMPAVLKDAIIKAYEDCGWDLVASSNSKGTIFPTFEDVCKEIDEIISRSDYSDENKGNYRGALKTRLNSLTNGINRLIFCSGDVSDESLFAQNVIVDLSRVGSSENKSLIMGMLIIRLQEYRMTEGGINCGLRHVTVLEEAHNILRRVSEGGSSEAGNLTQKSVEMIANAIAEMRTYGEGFIIADQAPGLLDMSVIRNTNTKIILRLPDQGDRELVGRAANLNDAQINELAILQRGVSAVYQNEWTEPILCKIKKYEAPAACAAKAEGPIASFEDEAARRFVNSCVYDPLFLKRHSEQDFVDSLEKIQIGGIVKARLMDYVRTPYDRRRTAWQKAAYSYFELNRCVGSENITLSGWQKSLIQQLRRFELEPEIDCAPNSVSMYRFVQTMTLETIVSLGNRQPGMSSRLTELMKEYRTALGK